MKTAKNVVMRFILKNDSNILKNKLLNLNTREMPKLSRGRVGVKITLGSVQKRTVRFLPQSKGSF